MRFTVQRDEFLQAVTSVQRASATRVIQPILANVLLEAQSAAGFLRVSATDLDFSLQTVINAEISVEGAATISAKKLSEILAKLPAKASVTLDIDLTVQTARVSCGSSVFDLRTLPADEFPTIPTLPEQQVIEVDLDAFLRTIRQTEFAAASYESNNVLGGIFFKLTPDALEMVATDGSRLARRVEALTNHQVTGEVSAIIPARTLQEFLKLGGAAYGLEKAALAEAAKANSEQQDKSVEAEVPRARIAIANGQIFLSTSRTQAVSRLLDGQYPRYEQLIPTSNRLVIHGNKLAMIASLERTAVMANERTHIVRMTLDAGQMQLVADTPDVGNAKDMVPVRYDGEPLQIAFNYKYVLDALKVIESDDVRMETNGSLAPTIFRASNEEGYLCLVMPVQVK